MTRNISEIIKCNPTAAQIASEWTGAKVEPVTVAKPVTVATVATFGKRTR
jgi:hypothetical protein